MKSSLLARVLTIITIVLLAGGASAGRQEQPPRGMGKYLIVLWEPGTPVPGKKDERMKRVSEPDVAQLGGQLLGSKANRRVVFLPFAAAQQLRKHEAVSYVQRLWTGEPFSEWNESEPVAPRRAAIASDSETFTWDRNYTYDADGNITQIGNDEFTYDGVSRLASANVDGTGQTFSYDGFGNLTGIEGPPGGPSIPVDPATNRLTGRTYDAAGNVTSRGDRGSYVYDSLNMIIQHQTGPVGNTQRILYDVNDERIGAIVDEELQRWTIRGFDGQILREFRGAEIGMDLLWSWEQDHVRGEGQLLAGESVTWSYGSTPTYGGKRHYHLDHLGSVRVVTSQTGKAISENDFFPFGTARTKQYQEELNISDPHADGMRFAGHWRDFMGYPGVEDDDYLDYMHARYYDPNLGRFLSVDPLFDLKLATRSPQSWNRYAYVRNNPLNAVDPTGMLEALVYGQKRDVYPGDIVVLTDGQGQPAHVSMIAGFEEGINGPEALVYENAPRNKTGADQDSEPHVPAPINSNSPDAGAGRWNSATMTVAGVLENRAPMLGMRVLSLARFTESDVREAAAAIGPVRYHAPSKGERRMSCDCAGYVNQLADRLNGRRLGHFGIGPYSVGKTVSDWLREVKGEQ